MYDSVADDLDDDDEPADAALVSCPYCGEEIEVLVDRGGGEDQSYVEDCEVCCRPWSVSVTFDRDGQPLVEVDTLDGE